MLNSDFKSYIRFYKVSACFPGEMNENSIFTNIKRWMAENVVKTKQDWESTSTGEERVSSRVAGSALMVLLLGWARIPGFLGFSGG